MDSPQNRFTDTHSLNSLSFIYLYITSYSLISNLSLTVLDLLSSIFFKFYESWFKNSSPTDLENISNEFQTCSG